MERKLRHPVIRAAVFLALVQIFLEDFVVITHSSWDTRRLLLCTGFGFDLFFTVEFLVGLYTAALNRKARYYLLNGQGWIDFLASVPLLVLYSGPAMFGLAAGGVPALPLIAQISRGIRFLRFLKIFRIQPFGPPGGQKVSGPALLVSVLVTAGALLGPLVSRPGIPEKRVFDKYSFEASRIAGQTGNEEDLVREIRDYSRREPDLLLVRREAGIMYSRYDKAYYAARFGPADYLHITAPAGKKSSLEFFFSLKQLLAEDARRSISYFCVLASLFLAFFIYSRIGSGRGSP
jgi:hypothetical protein